MFLHRPRQQPASSGQIHLFFIRHRTDNRHPLVPSDLSHPCWSTYRLRDPNQTDVRRIAILYRIEYISSSLIQSGANNEQRREYCKQLMIARQFFTSGIAHYQQTLFCIRPNHFAKRFAQNELRRILLHKIGHYTLFQIRIMLFVSALQAYS